MCYHTEFGCSALKGDAGEPKNWRTLEFRSLGMVGVADRKIHDLPHVLPCRMWALKGVVR